MLSQRFVLCVCLLGLLGGCTPNTSSQKDSRETFVAFGTLVNLDLYDVSQEQQTKISTLVSTDLQYLDYALHAWHVGSLGRVNQMMSAAGEFSANPVVIPVLQQAKVLSQQSDGLFNPALGQLFQLWGFQSDDAAKGPPPDVNKIKTILAQKPSMQDFSIKGVRIKNTNPAVRFDFGAIGKGYAVEKIAANLREQGIHNALLGAAGDIKAIGQHGDRPWQIGIRHPRNTGVIASTYLNDGEAISTSGDYERFFEYNGKRYHHILDPRTGYPADQTASVTVIHTDAAVADAAATALFIAGPKDWQRIAKQMGIQYVMLVDIQGTVYLTRAMQQRLHFEIQPIPVIQVSE